VLQWRAIFILIRSVFVPYRQAVARPPAPSPSPSLAEPTAAVQTAVPTATPFPTERQLDALAGVVAWAALIGCVVGAVVAPRALMFVSAVLGVYASVRLLYAAIANARGIHHMHTWAACDWRAHYQQHATADALPWADVRHLVVIPNYNEPPQVLAASLEALAAQDDAQTCMAVVLAMEAREAGAAAKAEALLAQFAGRFAALLYSVHPADIDGELACKSANQAYAARHAKAVLVDQRGWTLDHILVTTMDADTRWHPRYFAALAALFALHPQRHLRFWQGAMRYHGNVWQISPPMRLLHAYSAASELAYLSIGWWLQMPMSSYALSLRLLESCGYWDGDVIADEWHMYIKAYFATDGAARAERVFLPFLAHASSGATLWQVVVQRYQQTLRHAWGSKEVGYVIAQMLERPTLRTAASVRLLLRTAHDVLLAGAGWVILTVGSQLPLALNPSFIADFVRAGWGDPLFALLQVAFVLVLIGGIAFWWQDISTRPPRPTPITVGERMLTLASFPLLPILTLVFVGLPVLHAQTMLLFGVPLRFRVTAK
jgi:hypothetical protein